MDPARGDEEGVSGFKVDATTLVHQVPEEDIGLLARERPLLVDLEVCLSGGY